MGHSENAYYYYQHRQKYRTHWEECEGGTVLIEFLYTLVRFKIMTGGQLIDIAEDNFECSFQRAHPWRGP